MLIGQEGYWERALPRCRHNSTTPLVAASNKLDSAEEPTYHRVLLFRCKFICIFSQILSRQNIPSYSYIGSKNNENQNARVAPITLRSTPRLKVWHSWIGMNEAHVPFIVSSDGQAWQSFKSIRAVIMCSFRPPIKNCLVKMVLE